MLFMHAGPRDYDYVLALTIPASLVFETSPTSPAFFGGKRLEQLALKAPPSNK